MTDHIRIARVTPLPSLTVDPPHWSLPEPSHGLALRWDAAKGWVDVEREEAEKESEVTP